MIITKSDKELWDSFRNGDYDAFSTLYKRYLKELYVFGLNYSDDSDLLSDVIQELFIDFWRKRESTKDVENVKAYLYTSFRFKLNTHSDHLNKSKTAFSDIIIPEDTEPFEEEPDDEKEKRLQILKNKLENLPEKQKEILYLKYYQNLSNEEISKKVNINYQSVANLLQRALKNLRSKLIDE